jgi:uridine kinase
MARPIMVAVGGDSGSGKATLCAGLREIFGDDRCTEVRLDGYFGLNRAQRYAVGITALDPRAHDFAAMDEDLTRLAHGSTITKPVYNHQLGAISSLESVEPREIVLVQGLFPLYTSVLRALFDVSVWLEPDPELKLAWTIRRDVAERGYREEQVRAELQRRRHDYETFIAPQAAHADIRVSFGRAGVTFHKSARLAPLDYREFTSASTRIRLIDDRAGHYPRSIIEVDANIGERAACSISDAILKGIGARNAPSRPVRLGTHADDAGPAVSWPLAITQLLIARRIALVADQLSGAIAV